MICRLTVKAGFMKFLVRINSTLIILKLYQIENCKNHTVPVTFRLHNLPSQHFSTVSIEATSNQHVSLAETQEENY